MSDSQNPQQPSKPSLGPTVAKVAIGVAFIATGFTNLDRGIGFLGVALVIGGALIAWGVIPHIQYRQALEAAEEQQRLEEEQARQVELNKVKKCPACGARSQGERCEYCGHPLY